MIVHGSTSGTGVISFGRTEATSKADPEVIGRPVAGSRSVDDGSPDDGWTDGIGGTVSPSSSAVMRTRQTGRVFKFCRK